MFKLTIAAILVLAAACSPSATPSAVPAQPDVPKTAGSPTTLANASFSKPRIETEVQQVFELNYQARTLRPGGQFGVVALRGLVGGAYGDYTLPLLDREIRDAQAGVLQQVTFNDIGVKVDQWRGDGGWGYAEVSVTRTRQEVRAGASPSAETATYRFRLQRQRIGADGVLWVVYDFLNPATGGWISQPVTTPIPASDTQLATELKSFFNEFYQARTLTALHAFDMSKSASFVAGTYEAYTMPLLEHDRAEAESGGLKEVRYAGIAVRLEKWDPRATDHGGLATAAVTRTAFVTRSSGAEPPQVGTYEFRLHRHYHPLVFAGPPDPSYTGPTALLNWLIVDFLRPDVNRWVTDLAGATTIVPDVGHY